MTSPSPYMAPPIRSLSPSSPIPSLPHSSRHPMLNARPPHNDFLGTSSQDSNDLQDPLAELNFVDGYSFNISGDEAISSGLTHDTASVHHGNYSPSWPSASYPSDSLLFANSTTYPDMSISSPSPSLANLHDSYYPQNPSPVFNTPSVPTRVVPRIHVETEVPPFAPSSPPYDHHSAYYHSPQGPSPSTMFPNSFPSPSSIGSAPPITPDTPYSYISPRTPYISSASPISPSYVASQPPAFDPKESLITMPSDVVNVLDIASTTGHPHGGPFIPQKTYRPHTISDRRRYVDEVQLEAPIMFYSNKPVGCGILLRDAISSRFSTLEGRDDAMFQGRGPSVSIRLNWPGYAPWSRQIPTRDFRSPPQPITRAKLARNVAKTVQRFILEMEHQQMEDPSEAKWRVGTRSIRLEDLILVGLQHVSMGSWQAHVRLVQRQH